MSNALTLNFCDHSIHVDVKNNDSKFVFNSTQEISLHRIKKIFSDSEIQKVKLEIKQQNNVKEIWQGYVLLDENQKSFLPCILDNSDENGTSEISCITWDEIPSILDIFDGGYEALSEQNMGALLDDLNHFSNLVDGHLYVKDSENEKRIKINIPKPESLVELNEILIKVVDKNSHVSLSDLKGQITCLHLELFEQSYFLITQIKDTFEDFLVVSFTQHNYLANRRNGRRQVTDNLELGNFKVLDVGDFGIRLEKPRENSDDAMQRITVKLPSDFSCDMRVISSRDLGEKTEIRAYLDQDSPEIRKHWQHFVTKIYYPNLEWRTPETHETVWQLYEDTGYFKSYVGEWLKECKESVFKEWTYVDNEGPFVGSMVIGRNPFGQARGTIGVSRFSGGVWIAQAAAMSDKPEDLEITKNLYAWRTRNILLQKDGDYHCAIFEAEKKFLDRFFRKFYINGNQHYIHWDEFQVKALQGKYRLSNSDLGKEIIEENTPFVIKKIFEYHSNDLKFTKDESTIRIQGRPHQHLIQFTNSIWHAVEDKIDWKKSLESTDTTSFEMLFSKEKCDQYPFTSIDVGPFVVWNAIRPVLEKFNSNTLRAIHSMFSKYSCL